MHVYATSDADADAAGVIRSDLLTTLGTCVVPILPDEGPELDDGRLLANELFLGFSDGTSPAQILHDLGKQVTAGALAVALFACWKYWDTWGHTSAATWPEDRNGEIPAEPARLHHLLAVSRLLARAHSDLLARTPITGALANSLAGLAAALEQDGDLETARKVLLPALYCADQPSAAARLADELLRLLRTGPDSGESYFGMAIILRAQAIVETTPEGSGAGQLRAFDAYWAGVRHLDRCGDARPAMAAVLDRLAQGHSYLAAFRRLANSLASSPFGSDPDHFYAITRWPFEGVNASGALLALSATVGAVDDARRLLMPEQEADFVHADWNTWSFDWPAYPAAVPTGSAVAQAAEFADNLLLFRHESTHVASMIGTLGLSSVALRLAALDACFELHGRLRQIDDSHEADPQRVLPELVVKDVLLLAYAERLLELLRKAQILQSVWSPLMEGVAVFGELHSDFRSDDATTVVDNVLTQFLAEAEDPQDTLSTTELFDRVSARLRAAQLEAGPRRLRGYLTAHARQYAAGYLATRAIVSGWRRTLGGLGAAPAFRLLLSAVRYPAADALPDLGLPLRAFTQQAVDRAARWMRAVERTSRDDLARMRDYWTAEGVVAKGLWWTQEGVEEISAVEETTNALFDRALAEAQRSLFDEEHAPVDRLPESADDSRTVARMVAAAFALRTPTDRHVRRFAGSVSEQVGILPIGTATCAFWLAPRSRLLCLAVRAVDRGAGQPGGYQGQVIPLDEESFSELERAVHDNPTDRLRVTRLADLARTGTMQGRGLGGHLLVLTLGRWSHFRFLGSLARAAVDPALRAAALRRLRPEDLVLIERQVADAGRVAESVLAWLARPGPWEMEGRWLVDIDAWGQRVAGLAREVMSGRADGTRAAISARMLAGLPGQYGATYPISGIAQALDVPEGDVLAVLWDTSDGPATVPWLDGLDDPSVTCFAKSAAGWDVAPREPERGDDL